MPAFAVRGTVSSGFHAPSIAQLGLQIDGLHQHVHEQRQQRPDAGPHAAVPFGRSGRRRRSARSSSSRRQSTTYSLGVVVRPDSTSSITLDAYSLRIKDVITITDPVQGAAVVAAFNAAGMTGYTQASYYLNAWDARTNGVGPRRPQALRVRLLATRSVAGDELPRHAGQQREQLRSTWAATALTVIGNARIRDAETGMPKNKIVLNGVYSFGPWSIDATATRYSEYTYNVGNVPGVATANGNIDQTFSPETYLDLSLAYQAFDNLSFDLQVQNVFNKYPDKYVLGNRSSGINPYSFIAPNGAAGRFIQAGLNWSF